MIFCSITSALKNQNFADITSISLPTEDGSIEILPGHAEAFVELEGGTILGKKGFEQVFSVICERGVCYIHDDNVWITM